MENNILTEAIKNDIINFRLCILLYATEFKDTGFTTAMVSKFYGVTYTHASFICKMFVRKDYLAVIPSINKREKRMILTEKTEELIKIIGGVL